MGVFEVWTPIGQINYKIARKIAMLATPTTTVLDRLFVQTATINVGMAAPKCSQSNDTKRPDASNKDSNTSALNIQTGMYFSQRNTTSGNSTFLTNKKGTIRGIHVTSIQPTITKNVASVVVIPSSPQSLQQSLSRSVQQDALVKSEAICTSPAPSPQSVSHSV